MKTIIILVVFFLVALTACKKEHIENSINDNGASIDSSKPTNKVPVANAGPDQHLDAPTDNFLLDASASTDTDGFIVSWKWKKISGPEQTSFDSGYSVKAAVKIVYTGLYQYELEVEDNGGLFSKDTVNIFLFPPNSFCNSKNIPITESRLVPVWGFPFEIYDMGVVTSGSKVYFAGGRDAYTGMPTSQIAILDMETKEETSAYLSVARSSISCISAGNKILFAGGADWQGASSRVEIIDLSSGAGKTAELSEARWGISAAVLGKKIFFAGGVHPGFDDNSFSSRVDIYDMEADQWSTAALSEARSDIATVVVDNKIYFLGGTRKSNVSDAIDIYDAQTDSWQVSKLSEAAAGLCTIKINNKMYYAGGYNLGTDQTGGLTKFPLCQVEIHDLGSNYMSSANLFKPASSLVAAENRNKIIFFPGSNNFSYFFDVFDISTNSWSIGLIPNGLRDGVRFIYKDEIYIAGGYLGFYVGSNIFNSQILKLEL